MDTPLTSAAMTLWTMASVAAGVAASVVSLFLLFQAGWLVGCLVASRVRARRRPARAGIAPPRAA